LSPGAAPPGSAAMPGSNASPNSGQAQAAAAAASGQGGVAPGTAPSSAGASGSSLPGSVPTSHAQPGTSAPAEGAPSSSLRSDGAIGSAEKAKLEAESPIAQDATEPGEESERKPKGAAPPRSARSEADVPADRRLPSSGL
jgi:hypothetical protein